MLLWGCSSKKAAYQGNINGKEYIIYNVTKNNVFAKHLYQRLDINGSPSLTINYETTTMGTPYSLDIYNHVPNLVLNSAIQYTNTYTEESTNNTVLYIHPARFSAKDFETFKTFFSEEWPKIKNRVTLKQGYRELNIVALVFGNDDQFKHIFKSGDKALEVWTNGDVHLNTNNRSLESTNLSSKVQMPGYRLTLRQPYQPFNLDSLKIYKDASGKNITDYFTIEED